MHPASSGFEFGGTVPWLIPVVTLLVFVVAAQPWRPFTHGRPGSRAAAPQRA